MRKLYSSSGAARNTIMGTPQNYAMVLLYSLTLLVFVTTTLAQEDDKRSVATLARNGGLPNMRPETKKFIHPMTWQAQQELEKRLLHPLATSWQDRSIQENKRFSHPVAMPWQLNNYQDSKRFSHPVAMPWQAASLQEAIAKRFVHPVTWQRVQEALEKRFTHPFAWQDKRFVGSIARTGNLGQTGKRAEELTDDEMADAFLAELVAEFLQREREEENEILEEEENALDKRFVASLARTGALPTTGKRNIAAMARDGYLTQHRTTPEISEDEANAEDVDPEDAVVDEVTKRHLGALARSFNMPEGLTSGGKRNVGSLARSGLLSRITAQQRLEEDKRNIASYVRGRFNGKRSYLRGKYLPFAYARLSGIRDSFVDPGKRNIQALLKSWRPADQYSNGQGKRYPSYLRTNEIPSTRRYIAALMNSPARVLGQQNDGQKRHLGSLLGSAGNRAKIVQKKSVDTGAGGIGSKGGNASRPKREAPFFDETMLGSIEYPMPVLQGSDFYDYEEDLPMEDKRFLGRIPHMGRGAGKAGNSGGAGGSRRRPRGFSLRQLL